MSWFEFLKKDHQLPAFSTYRQPFFLGLALVLLPNVLFLLVAWEMGLARPIINVDYLLPVLIMFTPLPYKIGKMVGVVLLMYAILVDFMMFTIQLFPFLDLAAIKYLFPFLFKAPMRVWVITLLAFVYLFSFPYILNRIGKNSKLKFILMWVVIVGVFSWTQRLQTYHNIDGLRFGRNNYYVAQSQTLLYWSEMKNTFALMLQDKPTIEPYPTNKENAAHHFKQPYADKILLVVAESWGVARTPEMQQGILQAIYQQKNNFDFFEEGYFDFAGATVQGEMRELCLVEAKNGYAFGKLPQKTFANCLPNILKNKGYHTVGLHGASSQLYDRNLWYPSVGFQKVLFGEHLLNLKTCYAFNGVCDEQMIQLIGDEFKAAGNKKTFIYWLTLTAHVPYEVKDVRYPQRFDCEKLKVTAGDICNNMKLQAQLFDDLGELIKRPEMKGVEVIVVGDHMPPIFGDVPLYKNLRFNDVSWLHFKVKE